jgi:hypothetical protein
VERVVSFSSQQDQMKLPETFSELLSQDILFVCFGFFQAFALFHVSGKMSGLSSVPISGCRTFKIYLEIQDFEVLFKIYIRISFSER